jgi:hypothetical protein
LYFEQHRQHFIIAQRVAPTPHDGQLGIAPSRFTDER